MTRPWFWWALVMIIVHAAIAWPAWLPHIIQFRTADGPFVHPDAITEKRTTPAKQPLGPVDPKGHACCE